MVALIIVLGLLFIFLTVVLYFFCVAFVKRNMGNFDDVNDPCNEVLGEFRGVVGKSIENVSSREFVWVETKSFDGLTLKARYFPNGGKNTVLLFHGYRSSALRDMACAVELYSSFGLNVLLVDQRAHGKSDGRLITFGVKESKDAASWVRFVNKEYSPEKIILGGMSMGATTVLLAAGERLPENVKAVVADCGYTSPEEIICTVAKRYFKINATPFFPFLNLFCRIFGGFSIRNISTENVLRETEIPVLLIHGESDAFVPCKMSQRAICCCRNEQSRLYTVENAHHGMSYLVNSAGVTEKIREFLTNCHCLQSFH